MKGKQYTDHATVRSISRFLLCGFYRRTRCSSMARTYFRNRPFRTITLFLSATSLVFFVFSSKRSTVQEVIINESRVSFFRDSQNSEKLTFLIWDVGERLKRRFVRSFGKIEHDPFEHCSVRNCIFETNNAKFNKSNAVMFHLHLTKGPHTLPNYRPPGQLWIFFTDESPQHTFLLTHDYTMKDYNGLFNLSMTYRSDSDISVPYGRTVPLTDSEIASIGQLPDFAAEKTGLIAILGSNCGGTNKRWNYVRELQNYISVDIYGGCGKRACPGHFTKDCPLIKNYKFYLAFENGNCKEYMTEKLWWNSYGKNVVPVVMGSLKSDYVKLCPPKSFIHVSDFSSPKKLAEYLSYLNNNATAYNEYFNWKRRYKVVNEHGYFGAPTYHLCKICEALNKRWEVPKIYDNLQEYWNVKTDCYPPDWAPS